MMDMDPSAIDELATPNVRSTMFRKALTLPGMLLLIVVACEQTPMAPDGSHAVEASEPLPRYGASARLTRTTSPSPELPGPPFYARTAPPPAPVFIVDGWAVVQFYRDPACIRADFNLLEFFDVPGAFTCTLLVEGFAVHEGDPSSTPKVVRQQGIDLVPYWFVPANGVMAAIQDGVLTIGELAALPGRLVGYASVFSEMQHASAPPEFGGGGHQHPMLTQSARGTLEDGRAFVYHLTEIDAVVKSIELHFK